MHESVLLVSLCGLLLGGAGLAAEAPERSEIQRIWGEVAALEGKLVRPSLEDRQAMQGYAAAVAEAKATVARRYPESPVGLMVAGAAGNGWAQLVEQGKLEYAAPARELLQPLLASPPEGARTGDLRDLVVALALIHGATGDMASMDRVLARGEELGVEVTGFYRESLMKYLRARPGEPAPPLRGKTAAGEDFDLVACRGRPVLVHFWSSHEMEMLESLAPVQEAHERFGARGLAIVGVNLDADPSRVQSPPPKMHVRVPVGEWAAAQGVDWPQLVVTHDPAAGRYFAGKHNPHAEAWGVWETHALFLVGPDGTVLLRRPADPGLLFEALADLLPPAASPDEGGAGPMEAPAG